MKILIVDDSKIILKMANDLIVSNKICNSVLTADSGEKCLEILEKEDIDVILLDIIMPGINGLDVLRELNRIGKLEYIKVLMFTSLSDRNALKTSFELGASDYIGKPIEPVEFLARIKSAINEKKLRNKLRAEVLKTNEKNDELSSLYDKLRETQAQLIHREKLVGIGQLAAGVAHEINNPLSYVTSNMVTLNQYIEDYKRAMIIYGKIIEKFSGKDNNVLAYLKTIEDMNIEFINDDIEDLFHDIKEGLERVKNIVKGIRFFSNVDSSNEIQPYNINEGIRSILLITENRYKPDIEIEMNLNDIPEFMGYVAEINQALLNIIINSIEAIKRKSQLDDERIAISTDFFDNTIICTIKDTGIGMEEETINNIFNPFFTTKDIGEGKGIGLSIAYDVFVNKQKGTIDVFSESDRGTEILIQLPLVNNIVSK